MSDSTATYAIGMYVGGTRTPLQSEDLAGLEERFEG